MKTIKITRALAEDIIIKLYKKDTFYPILVDKYLSFWGYDLSGDFYYEEILKMNRRILGELNNAQIETLLLKI